MKTNTLTIILATVALGGIALIAKLAANFDLLALGVSYIAVALLAVLAISDHRGNVRDYSSR